MAIIVGFDLLLTIVLLQQLDHHRWLSDFNGRRAEFWKSQADRYVELLSEERRK